MSNQSSPPPRGPADPVGPRKSASPALVITGVGLALLVLGALLVWLVLSLVSEIGASPGSGGAEPGVSQRPGSPVPETAESTGARPRDPASASEAPAPKPAATSPGAPASPGSQDATTLRAPEEGALVTAEGTFSEMVVEEKSSDVVSLPDRDEPLLVVWSNSQDEGNGTFFLTGFNRSGGDITDSLGIVRGGQTGMQLINLDSDGPRTRVLYPKGNEGVAWRVSVFPLSAVPEASRGARLTGNGPAALRLPAGRAGGYRLSVKGEGAPSIEVFDTADPDLPAQFEYGTAPVDLDVTVGAGEHIIQVDSGSQWLLEPR